MIKGHGPMSASGWLWSTAILIAIIGGTVTYLFSLEKVDPSARAMMSMSLAVTIIGSGICVICATASLWLKR